MTARTSAGLLLYRRVPGGADGAAADGAGGDEAAASGGIEVLIGHMGGPWWARRDAGAWTVPKGEYGPDEAPLDAARREFVEELGLPVPAGPVLELGSVRQSGGKTVTVFALRGDLDPEAINPGTFTMVWPPRSGVLQEFPELDRVAWMTPGRAAGLLVTAQRAFLGRLDAALAAAGR
jgi:predicted NUDIX family NTP pyrophosphohydrolase